MGADNSTPRGPGAATTTERKTCYYELLGLERSCADEEIRRAYKKKALEYHPDRNYGDTENATRKFAEVQTAYEVLSDPQERAWYDSHRDAILRGDDGGDDAGEAGEHYDVRITTTEELFALMGKFNSSVPFTDAPTGFFGILEATFAQLALEETAAASWEGVSAPVYPPFGGKEDGYVEVAKPFYAAWAGFATRKSFSWKDRYRASDAPDRRVRRLVEKENKKFREDGIREFNDAVRSLVAFVRKRDPRYVPNSQTEAERQQVLRDSAAQQAKRAKEANRERMEGYVVPEWARSRGDGTKSEGEGEFEESEEEDVVEQIECVVCRKTFKSEKQFEAHEKSKKHVKAVQQLRWQMRKENKDLDLKPKKNREVDLDEDVGEDFSGSDAAEGEAETEGNADDAKEVADEDSDVSSPSRPTTTNTEGVATPVSDSADEDDDYAPRSKLENRLAGGALQQNDAAEVEDIEEITAGVADLDVDKSAPGGKKLGKAKAKREKKAARQAEQEQEGAKCAVCKEPFSSRTALFKHIKDEGHAAPPSTVPKKGGKKGKR